MKRARRILYFSSAAALTLSTLAAGCDGDPDDPCPFADIKGTTIAPGGKEVTCTQASFNNNIIGFQLDPVADVGIALYIEQLNPAADESRWPLVLEADEQNFPWTLQAVRLAQGDGKLTSLCEGIAEGSTVRIDSVTVDREKTGEPFDFITTMAVTFDATLTGCTVPEWGLTDADLPLKGVARVAAR